jgi:hypothetical protein
MQAYQGLFNLRMDKGYTSLLVPIFDRTIQISFRAQGSDEEARIDWGCGSTLHLDESMGIRPLTEDIRNAISYVRRLSVLLFREIQNLLHKVIQWFRVVRRVPFCHFIQSCGFPRPCATGVDFWAPSHYSTHGT